MCALLISAWLFLNTMPANESPPQAVRACGSTGITQSASLSSSVKISITVLSDPFTFTNTTPRAEDLAGLSWSHGSKKCTFTSSSPFGVNTRSGENAWNVPERPEHISTASKLLGSGGTQQEI